MLLGAGAGIIVALLTAKVLPALRRRGIHDTFGVVHLHGIAGFFSAICGMIATAVAKEWGHDIYGEDYKDVFYKEQDKQAEFQLAFLFISIGTGAVGGAIIGAFLRFVFKMYLPHEPDFTDHRDFRVPSDYPPFVTR
jgi:ammonia channel protein AmtB